ncbi:MAG: signal peptide peptidase SppA [Desulfovibrionaceae bacterium]
MRCVSRLLQGIAVLALCALAAGCAPTITMFGGGDDSLREVSLWGEGKDKVAFISLRGVISDEPKEDMWGERPGTVQAVVSRLELVREDKAVKAVVLAIDSPGGSVTASDILYRELQSFKEDTGIPVVAAFMDMAASGGYYVAAAADAIVAHPTTVTGSIGVIFVRPDVEGLMKWVGVRADVIKSGRLKDMGSPFRNATAEEHALLQAMIDENMRRFLDVVRTGRELSPEQVEAISDARILTATQALDAGLVDRIGYLDDAVDEAAALAGIDGPVRLVAYRDAEYPNDTMYNTMSSRAGGLPRAALDMSMGLSRYLAVPRTGFYYLWAPEMAR